MIMGKKSGRPSIARLAERINAHHEQAHAAARTAIEHAVECGRLLIEAKAQVSHGQWLPWVEVNLRFGERQARKYMRLAEHEDQLANRNCGSDLGINAALALFASSTMRLIGSSESPEWYTPPHIFGLATETLVEVDLDPCWHPDSPVRARTTYTAPDDGLTQQWAGRVWLNPPYGRAVGAWISKLVDEYNAGRVTEALALVPARVDTEWFRALDPFPRCFPRGRLSFSDCENSAPFPAAIPYLGPNVERFAEVFGGIGGIWTLWQASTPPSLKLRRR